MNIYQLRDNLIRVITNKQIALKQYEDGLSHTSMAEGVAHSAVIEFLKINLEELNNILLDVQKCVSIAEFAKEIHQHETN